MTRNTTDPTVLSLGAASDALMRQEQARLHAATWPAAISGSLVLAVVLVAVLAPAVPHVLLGWWLAAVVGAVIARVLLGRAQARGVRHNSLDFTWVWRHRVVSGVHGLLWACAAWGLFPAEHPLQQTFLVFALAGGAISSLLLYAFDLRSTYLFSAPGLVVLTARLFTHGTPVSTAQALALLMFLACMGIVSVRAHRAVRVNVALRAADAQRLEALRRSHEQLGRAERLARMGSFESDPVTRSMQWSDEHFRLWGLEPQSVRPSAELFLAGVHPDDRERQQAALRAAMRGEARYDCTYRVCRPDGSVGEIHGVSEVMFDPPGQAVRVLGTVQDVTERNAAQRALALIGSAQDAVLKAEFVVNSVDDLISMIDQKGVYLMVNDAWCRQTGHARTQVIGRTTLEVMPELITEERKTAARECIEQRQPRVLRSRVELPQRGARFLETTLTPFVTPEAGVRGVIAVTRDITEQEATRVALATSLENLRRTFNATTDGMFAYDARDPDGRLLFANDRFFEMWEIPLEQAVGTRRADVIVAARKLFVEPDREVQRINDILALDVPHEDRVVLRDGRVFMRRSGSLGRGAY